MEALAFAGLALLSGGITMCRNKTKPATPAKKKCCGGKKKKAAGPLIRVAYWDMCGLGQPCRLLAEYGGLNYKDVRYKVKQNEDGSYDRSHWTDEKHELGLDFPNLPYLIEGDFNITESNAIMSYLGDKAGLGADTAEGRGTVMMLLCIVMDVRNKVVGTAYGSKEGYPERLAALREKVPMYFDKLGNFMKGRDWLAPHGLSAPDFHFYEMLRQLTLMMPDCLDAYPNLKAYVARFEALPTIAAYMKSDRYVPRPCNNPMAAFK